MEYVIRESTPDDGQALVQIWRSSVAATHSFVSSADLASIDAQVECGLPHAKVWLALGEEDEPVGFMGLADHAVDSLFVAGDRLGRGVGRQLIQFAMEGRSHLTTVVNQQNAQAVGFYEHVGFVVVGRSPTDEDGRPYPVLHMWWGR